MKKLLIYGDSILRGVTYSEKRARHTLVEGSDLKNLCELGYEVKNRSRMGATITRGLDMLSSDETEIGKGDFVLLEYGGNDCDYEWGEISKNPEGDFAPHTPEEKFTKEYSLAIEKVRKRGATPILSTLVPVDAERYVKWISRNNSYENIMSWLGDTSMLYRWQERYNRLVENTARLLGCPIIDLRERFLLSHNYKELICYDGIHPSAAGHEMIRKCLTDNAKLIMHNA